MVDTFHVKNVENGYTQVIYDPGRKESEGHWVCQECDTNFGAYILSIPIHAPECTSTKENCMIAMRDARIAFVIGPKWDGNSGPFNQRNVDKIKLEAKEFFTQPRRKSFGDVIDHLLHRS